MHRLQIELESAAYRPGEMVQGKVTWELEKPVDRLELRLFWHTQGKGTRDIGVVATTQIPTPKLRGSQTFSYRLPDGPWSFSGSLITLTWSVEIITVPGDEGEHVDFVLSPTGEELRLQKVEK